jgi:hypothetical protein
MPSKAYQSKLRPHAEDILSARTAGKTWQEIVNQLAAVKCEITLSALRRWTIRYKRRPFPQDLGIEPVHVPSSRFRQPPPAVPLPAAMPTAKELLQPAPPQPAKRHAKPQQLPPLQSPGPPNSAWGC